MNIAKSTNLGEKLSLAGSLSLLTLSLSLSAAGDAITDHKDNIIRPSEIAWVETPEFPGLEVAVLSGDPASAGFYVMYPKFKPGFMTKPHYHTADRFVTVVSGTWWAAIGENESPESTVPVTVGSSMFHAANEIHFDGAKAEEVIVQITGLGPVATFYVAAPEKE